ncbi:MAG: 6-phosphogluconolactonase [Methylacidiphilales bacterium]|nr:6-phosphogluconolactonase [Candidatus Methylacidiphilales bacterium]
MTHLRFESENSWIEALIKAWQQAGSNALQKRGNFTVSLSGGSSPESFYKALSKIEWPWSSTQLFIGDERWVPADHKDSNYHMIYESFYPRNVRLERWKTELQKPEDAASDYERRLHKELSHPTRFDLVLLGIGNDGHTASLFPGTKALEENSKLAVANWVPQADAMRLTLTYPLFKLAREIWFVSKGAEKQPWIEKMAQGQGADFPAGRIACDSGEIRIFNCTV